MGKVQVKQGEYIQVVASVNVDSNQAEIMYVNPATSATLTEPDDADQRVTIELLSATGVILDAVHPALQLSSCRGGEADDVALIQEYLPAHPEAARVRLNVNGRMAAEFSSGAQAAAAGPAIAMRAKRAQTMSFNAGPKLILNESTPPAANVTYSIQARAKNAKAWSTLAVGRHSPEVLVDSNQFPGQSQVEVRVLESNGFSDHEVAREIYQLKK